MHYQINTKRKIAEISEMIYGSFLEHHHRQIYGGVYDPSSPFADEDGFREDVMEAIRELKVPVIRWPGGCFVDDYHWYKGVGSKRVPSFDKNWKVEEPNTFGTDEFVKFCRKVGAEPYLCTNANALPEEASDWVEYCNLLEDGEWAKLRIANGFQEPHHVKYWSIGNENYYKFEIAGMGVEEWLQYSERTAKMIKRVDPDVELTAALHCDNLEWTTRTLNELAPYLDWVSVHGYWDFLYFGNLGFHETSDEFHSKNGKLAGYETCMKRVSAIPDNINRMRGLLAAMKLDKKIKIAFDEWNLRGWFHPYIIEGHPNRKNTYLPYRDENDNNTTYTMADAVFSACFLNACTRNADIVGMANFSPLVNTRGAIFTHEKGLVKRSTYYVFDLYTKHFGDVAVDIWDSDPECIALDGKQVEALDVAASMKDENTVCVAVSNKDPENSHDIYLKFDETFLPATYSVYTVTGESKDSYNDVGRTQILPSEERDRLFDSDGKICLKPHSVNIIEVKR